MRYRAISDHADYVFAGDPGDIRGWELRTSLDGQKVGRVYDVLMDSRNRLRYLDVDTGGSLGTKRVLVPIDLARAEPGERTVYVRGMNREHIRALPEYAGDVATVADYERRLSGLLPLTGRRLDARKRHSITELVRARRPAAGAARARPPHS